MAAFQIGEGNAELAGRRAGSSSPVETANGEFVSGNFFRTFGISAWRGRLFTDADDQEGAPPTAVMSFHVWAGEIRIGSFGRRSDVPAQRPPVYDPRCGPAGLLRSEDRGLEYARFLDAARDGTTDRRRNFTP